MPAALEWLVAVDLVRPHPPQTTGVAKPEPKIEPGGQIAEGLHGQYGYLPASGPVKGFFQATGACSPARACRAAWTGRARATVVSSRGAGFKLAVRVGPQAAGAAFKSSQGAGSCCGEPGVTGKRSCEGGSGLLNKSVNPVPTETLQGAFVWPLGRVCRRGLVDVKKRTFDLDGACGAC